MKKSYTVRNVRQRLIERGLNGALARKKQEFPSRRRLLDGEKEAQLLAVTYTEPPEGRARWMLYLLADKLVELELVESISHETVRLDAQKTN